MNYLYPTRHVTLAEGYVVHNHNFVIDFIGNNSYKLFKQKRRGGALEKKESVVPEYEMVRGKIDFETYHDSELIERDDALSFQVEQARMSENGLIYVKFKVKNRPDYYDTLLGIEDKDEGRIVMLELLSVNCHMNEFRTLPFQKETFICMGRYDRKTGIQVYSAKMGGIASGSDGWCSAKTINVQFWLYQALVNLHGNVDLLVCKAETNAGACLDLTCVFPNYGKIYRKVTDPPHLLRIRGVLSEPLDTEPIDADAFHLSIDLDCEQKDVGRIFAIKSNALWNARHSLLEDERCMGDPIDVFVLVEKLKGQCTEMYHVRVQFKQVGRIHRRWEGRCWVEGAPVIFDGAICSVSPCETMILCKRKEKDKLSAYSVEWVLYDANQQKEIFLEGKHFGRVVMEPDEGVRPDVRRGFVSCIGQQRVYTLRHDDSYKESDLSLEFFGSKHFILKVRSAWFIRSICAVEPQRAIEWYVRNFEDRVVEMSYGQPLKPNRTELDAYLTDWCVSCLSFAEAQHQIEHLKQMIAMSQKEKKSGSEIESKNGGSGDVTFLEKYLFFTLQTHLQSELDRDLRSFKREREHHNELCDEMIERARTDWTNVELVKNDTRTALILDRDYFEYALLIHAQTKNIANAKKFKKALQTVEAYNYRKLFDLFDLYRSFKSGTSDGDSNDGSNDDLNNDVTSSGSVVAAPENVIVALDQDL